MATVRTAKLHSGEKGMMSSILQLFSTLVHKNAVEVAKMQAAENALFDSMLEELKASTITAAAEQTFTEEKCITTTTTTITSNTITKYTTPNLSKFHLVLDIDGTLVHTVAQHESMIFGEPDYEEFDLHLCSYKRPGLDAFIEFCFTHFQSVSLWTAGTQEYADFIARSIAPKGFQFLFVLSRMHCRDHPAISETLVKDMNDLWNSEIAKTFQITQQNTLIIDDNEDYCFCNLQNAIIVKTWKYLHAADFTFTTLTTYLETSDADTASSLCWGAA